MPYKSKAQARWAHTPAGQDALGGPGKVAEWDAETAAHRKRLPEKRRPKGAGPHKYGEGETRVR